MINIPILIPAYNPDQRLIPLVESLIRENIAHIVIVNDGSHAKSDVVFEQLEKLKSCTLLTHAVNLGKGRALKTGLNHIYMQFPDSPGVVTADCDGQHRPEDILAVARALTEAPDQLIMGVRKMGNKVPFRSRFGNVCTRFIFSFAIGKKVSDTQSGLRGLPRAFIPQLLSTKGEGYEFEINMLILTKLKTVKIHEVVIDTIYIEDNKSSHFNPLIDSMKIYFQLLRFAFSSLLASFFDFIIFSLMFKLTSSIVLSLLIGRFLVGSLLNYVINRRLVFHSNTRVLWTLIKYYIALIVMSLLSYLLIHFAMEQLGLKVMLAKIVVETLLFALSFSLQREFVFTAKEED